MVELNELINLYRTNHLKLPPDSPYEPWEVSASTITYLEAFKQVHEMLKRLGEAIQGVDLEGDGP